MYEDNHQKYLKLLKRILTKIKPRFSFHYVAYTTLFLVIISSVFNLVSATTPNPGHPWSELGDGVFVFTNSQTVTPYTYTFPAANTTVLTTNASVTVAQGGTGLGSIADGSVLATNAANVLSEITWHSAGTKILTNTSGTITWETAASGMTWPAGGAGIPNYSGSSSWGTSYTTSGSGTVLALNTSPVLTTPTVVTSINPSTDDGATLGDTTHNYSDLFLATGAVINYQNGNVVLTHSSGVLTMGTGTLKITNPTNTTTSVVTIDGTQTLTNKTLTSPNVNEAVALTSTSTKLNYLTSATGTTGTNTTNIVFSTSPALTTPTVVTSIVGDATFAAFNTVTTNLSLGGAATTLTIGGTPTTAITHNYSTNATATGTTKTVNLGTGSAAGSTTNVNIGSSPGGTTTINSPTLALGTGNLTMSGSIGVTGTRITKLWATDLQTTNAPIIDSLTASRVVVSGASKELTSASTTTTQVNYLSSATGTTGTNTTNLVFSTSPSITTPTFVTNATVPLLIGGSAAGSNITYQSTTGTGTVAGIAHQFTGGTNGGTVIETMLNNGNVGIGITNPTVALDVVGTVRGMPAFGAAYGGYFLNPTGTGTGVYGEVGNSSGNVGPAYGGYFTNSNIGTGGEYGIYTSVSNASAPRASYALYATNAGAGYGIYSNSGLNYFSGNVGIGTTDPGEALDVVGDIRNSTGDFITTNSSIRLLDSTSAVVFRGVRANSWTDNVSSRFFQIGSQQDNVVLNTANGWAANRLMINSASTQVTDGSYATANAPAGVFEVSNGTAGMFNVMSYGNVGIGTTVPTAYLHLKAGLATTGNAPLKFTNGTLNTTPENGAVEYDGSHYYGSIGVQRYQLDRQASIGLLSSKGLLLGDSTVATYSGLNPIDTYLLTTSDTLAGTTITNAAVSGHTIAQQQAVWTADGNKSTYDWIAIMVGLNDMVTPAESAATVIGRYQTLINTINAGKKAGGIIIVSTMTPERQYLINTLGGTNGPLAYQKWLDVNTAIMGGGATPVTGVDYRVNNHTLALNDGAGNLAQAYDNGDYIHENNAGRAIVASEWRSVLKTAGFLTATPPTIYDKYFSNNSGSGTYLKNGYLGVGTTNPLHKLEVAGDDSAWTSIASIGLTDTYTGGTSARNWGIYNGALAVGDLEFLASTTQGGSSDSGRNVLILKSDGTVNIPTGALNIGTAGTYAGSLTLSGVTSGTTTFAVPSTAGSYTFTLPPNGGTNNYVLSTNGSGTTSWIPNGSGSSQWTTQASNIYYNTGNVGIGVTAPVNPLEVVGTGNTAGVTNNQVLGFFNSTTDIGGVFLGYVSGLAGNNITSTISVPKNLAFDTYNGSWGEAMRIQYDGKVGIGVTNPAAKLEIVDTAISGRETPLRVSVSDASSVFGIKNSTATGGVFEPSFYGASVASNRYGLIFQGMTTAANDTASDGLMGFFSMIHSGDPVNGTFSDAANRQLFNWGDSNSILMVMDAAGRLAIGDGLAPTARLHLGTSSGAAGTAPLKLTSGTNLGTTEAGAIEYNGTHLYFTATNGGTRYQLDQQGGGGTWDTIGDAGGNGAIAMGATVQTMDWATATTQNALTLTAPALSSGNLFSITSNGTGALTNQTGLDVQLLGANSNATQTTYAANFSNSHTGTSAVDYAGWFEALGSGTTSKNVGLYATANGATTNYAAIFDQGSVGIGTTNPSSKLEVRGVTGAGAVATVLSSAVNGSKYGYAENQYGLFNSAAGTPYKQMYSFGAEGTYSDAGTLTNYDFYIYDSNATAYRMYVKGTGNIGIGTTDPTAALHLKAGTASAGTAPLKLTSSAGALLGTTEAGAIEFDGTHLYFTVANAGTRYQLDQQGGSVSADSLDFTEFKDAMVLDASTSFAFGASNFGLTFTNNGSADELHNLTSTGSFVVQDGGVNALKVDSSGLVTLGQSSAGGAIGKLAFANATNANTVTLQSGTTAGNYTWTLPTAAPSAGCLQSDGSGNLSVATCGDVNSQPYTANGNWTIPTGALLVFVEMWGGGGGGGGGAGSANFTASRSGGGGGGGSAYVTSTFSATSLGTPGSTVVAVTVGTGGNGGNGGNNAIGQAGSAGGASCFSSGANCASGIYLRSFGGGGGGPGAVAGNVGAGGGGGGGSLAVGTGSGNGVGGAGGAPAGAAANTANTGSGGGGGGTSVNAGAAGGAGHFGGAGGAASSLNGSANGLNGGGSVIGGSGGGAGGGMLITTCSLRGGGAGGTGSSINGGGGAGSTTTGGAGTAGANGVGGGGDGGGGGANGCATTGGAGGNGGVRGGGGGGAGAGNAIGGRGGNGGVGYVRVWTYRGQGADLAEIYGTNDTTIEAGDVVAIDDTMNAGVKKTSKQYEKVTIGVASTKPGLLIGSIEDPEAQPVMVALAGRVPVKVNMENGPINKGDYLTPSSVPGEAMKSTKAGLIIGQSMTDYNTLDMPGFVVAFIKSGPSNGATLASILPDGLSLDSPPALEDGKEIPIVEPTTPQKTIQQRALAYFNENKAILEKSVDISEITTDRLTAGLEVITPTLISSNVFVDVITSSLTGSIVFNSPVEFNVPPLFNKDTAGFAVIKQGDKRVRIDFETPYIAEPSVSASLVFSLEDSITDMLANNIFDDKVQSIIVDSDKTGFTILLNKNAPRDLRYSWNAFSVKDAKVFESVIEGLNVEARPDPDPVTTPEVVEPIGDTNTIGNAPPVIDNVLDPIVDTPIMVEEVKNDVIEKNIEDSSTETVQSSNDTSSTNDTTAVDNSPPPDNSQAGN